MKRAGHLIEKIADFENLQLAYYKAQKSKADKREVIAYAKRLQENLRHLQEQIMSGEVETGNYHFFTIYDPKQRLICAAPFGQRVLHHALMNVCHPYFEKVQIFDSYATRPEKGTYAALARAKRFNQLFKKYLLFQKRCTVLKLKRAAIVGSNRVLRGGSWNNNAQNCRSANRNRNNPDNRNNNIGFRVVFVP